MTTKITDHKKKLLYLFAAELFFMLVMVFSAFMSYRRASSSSIQTSLADWQSGYVFYRDGWHIDESILSDPDNPITLPIDFLYGPCITLPKGTYTVKIQYRADSDQSFHFGNQTFVQGGLAKLSKNQTLVTYRVALTDTVENFRIFISYNGQGSLDIQDVSISRNTIGAKKSLVLAFLLIVIVNGLLLLSKRPLEERKTFWILVGITLLVSIPLLGGFIPNNIADDNCDLFFHLMRIDALAHEIKNGVIPVRMSSLWVDGYGYPASIYYGDLLLYVPACLRVVGFSITTCYIVYCIMINAGTAFLSYLCFRTIFRNRNIALLTCLAYMSCSYRLNNLYIRGAVGEYSAMLFFPVIVLAVYLLYTCDTKDAKARPRYALLLAIGMSGLIETHILSTEMVVIVLCLVCLVLFKRTFRWSVIKTYLLAVVLTLLLSMWFIVPFLDYFTSVETKLQHIDFLRTYSLTGVTLADLFLFFPTNNRRIGLLYTPGIVLMTGFLIAVCYIYRTRKGTNKELLFYMLFSTISLVLASRLFPWKHLAYHYAFGKILAQVQFPWRYLGIASVFLCLLLGKTLCLLSETNASLARRLLCLTGCVCVLSTLYFVSCSLNSTSSTLYDTPELNTSALVGGEYMLSTGDRQAEEVRGITGQIASSHMEKASILSRKGTDMQLYCQTKDVEGAIEAPIFHYKGYHVFDDTGREYPTYNGDNFTIGFRVPAHFDGTITIQYIEPWYWRAAEAASGISLLVLAAWLAIRLIQNRRIKQSEQESPSA